MKIFRNKRGLSPLIATILLIAFAVALGAVVMNIGKNTLRGMDAGFAILDLGGKKQICYFDRAENSALEITIKNGNVMEITDFQVSIVGTEDISLPKDQILTAPLQKGEVRRVMVMYDGAKTGTLTKVLIRPKILRNGERTLGTELEVEGIGPC